MNEVKVSLSELDSLIIYAFRYAHTRQTFAPSTVKDILIKYWNILPENTKKLIIKEIYQSMSDKDYSDIEFKTWNEFLFFVEN